MLLKLVQTLELKFKTDGDRPILKETPAEEQKVEKKLPELPKENTEERSYTFELFHKAEQPVNESEDEGEASLFADEDEFEVGKEISADQVINEDGMMEVRKTKQRLEQQAKDRREKLKSKKQEMTKEEFNDLHKTDALRTGSVDLCLGVKIGWVKTGVQSKICQLNYF